MIPAGRTFAHVTRQLSKLLLALLLALLIVSQSGCIGTMLSRGNHDFAGKYPLQAVACDIQHVVNDKFDGLGILVVTGCIISVPVDLAVDVVLMPVDLVLWPFGFDRGSTDGGSWR